jgi:hypothetical protein
MYNAIRLLGLTGLFVVTVFIGSALSADFTVMQGWLIDEECMEARETTCLLEKYSEEKLVLLTADDQIYRLKKNGVESWKLQKAYGQLIGVKGLKEGDMIKVTNIVQVTGDKKLTKA